MVKVPLTKDGVLKKQTELFALDQKNLDVEANAIVADFKTWINTNFDLTTAEQGFLNSANEDFIRFISSIVFVGVRNKFPIDFSKTLITTAVKRFDTKAKLNVEYQWGGSLKKDTEIKLDIVYL